MIQIGVFPDLADAKYKTLADERLCLNNLLLNLIRMGVVEKSGIFAVSVIDSAFVNGKE